jgi:hypothetical protein
MCLLEVGGGGPTDEQVIARRRQRLTRTGCWRFRFVVRATMGLGHGDMSVTVVAETD